MLDGGARFHFSMLQTETEAVVGRENKRFENRCFGLFT